MAENEFWALLAAFQRCEDVDAFSQVAKILNEVEKAEKPLVRLCFLWGAFVIEKGSDLSILLSSSFLKTSFCKDPWTAALALKTMSNMFVMLDSMDISRSITYSLNQEEAYSRNIAVMAVLKVACYTGDYQNTIDILLDQLKEENEISVIGNIVTSLTELNSKFSISTGNFEHLYARLVSILPNSSDWTQLAILTYLQEQSGGQSEEMLQQICALLSELSTADFAIHLTCIKILVAWGLLKKAQIAARILSKLRKMLQCTEYEYLFILLQYCKEELITREDGNDFFHRIDVSLFFYEDSEPMYIQVTKLSILSSLINERNSESLLPRIEEYVTKIPEEYQGEMNESLCCNPYTQSIFDVPCYHHLDDFNEYEHADDHMLLLPASEIEERGKLVFSNQSICVYLLYTLLEPYYYADMAIYNRRDPLIELERIELDANCFFLSSEYEESSLVPLLGQVATVYRIQLVESCQGSKEIDMQFTWRIVTSSFSVSFRDEVPFWLLFSYARTIEMSETEYSDLWRQSNLDSDATPEIVISEPIKNRNIRSLREILEQNSILPLFSRFVCFLIGVLYFFFLIFELGYTLLLLYIYFLSHNSYSLLYMCGDPKFTCCACHPRFDYGECPTIPSK